MTRSSVLAVTAFAALSSSCLVSTDALAFCRWYGGRYHSSRPIADQPLKHSSSATIRQTRLATSSARTGGDGHHTAKVPGLFAEVTAVVTCPLCVTPAPDGMPPRHGNGGVGGAASGAGKTNDVVVSGERSGVDKTNDVAVGGERGSVDKTNNVAVSGDRSGADRTNGLAVSGDRSGVTVIGGRWTGIGAGGDAEDTAFRAIALGLSDDGAWVVRTAPTLATAGAGALRACSEQFGPCTLSDAQVAPTHFGCLVVIQSDDASRVFAAAGDSSDLARAEATAQIANAGLRGQVVFTGCNS
jgi:hypothetical protein